MDKIDTLFRDKFKNYEHEVSMALWHKIRFVLFLNAITIGIKTFLKSRKVLRIIGIVALISAYYFGSKNNSVKSKLTKIPIKITQNKSSIGKRKYFKKAVVSTLKSEKTKSHQQYQEKFDRLLTPNGDSINDFFYLRAPSIKELEAKITDKNGNVVYMWSALDGGWDGTDFSGKLSPAGLYKYEFKVNMGEEIIVRKGVIKLKR